MHPVIIKLLKQINIDVNYGELRDVPNNVILASIILSISAVSQWVVDIIFEVVSHTDLIPSIPFRIDFISLTFISALLALQTFKSLNHKVLNVTTSALHLALLVECSLVIGDVYFLSQHAGDMFLFYFRLPFIILTTINIFLVTYMWMVISPHRHIVYRFFNPRHKKSTFSIGRLDA